jgi:LysM repeat protein
VLGTDVVESNSDREGAGMGKKRGDTGRKSARGSSATKKAPLTWGPSGGLRRRDDSIGAESLVDRDLAVKAMKTASVLESHEGANGGLDVNGNYKRRTSLERPTTAGQKIEEDDALVYVHHVQPSDTLAGVVLKYSCQPAVFRKANGLYPNDMIQVREVVFLPVDTCAIKGRPCDPPSDNKPTDLLAPTPEMEDPPSSSRSYSNGGPWGQDPQDTGTAGSPSFDRYNTDQTKTEEQGKPWVHVRWVVLDSSPSAKPIEIARLPRKTLGYFPPRRRRSYANSSSVSTPRGSFDVRHMPQLSQEQIESAISTPPRQRSNIGSPSREASYFPAPTLNPLSRREGIRNLSTPPMWLQGPGGVGTLDMRSPGPSQGISIDLEHAAAAIEGWVRRLAIKATPGTPKLGIGSNKATPDLGEGDLIELLDGAGSDDGGGLESLGTESSRHIVGAGSGRDDHAAVLRGRLLGVTGTKGKSD